MTVAEIYYIIVRVGPEIGKGTLKGRQKMLVRLKRNKAKTFWCFYFHETHNPWFRVSDTDWSVLGLTNYNAALEALNSQLLLFEEARAIVSRHLEHIRVVNQDFVDNLDSTLSFLDEDCKRKVLQPIRDIPRIVEDSWRKKERNEELGGHKKAGLVESLGYYSKRILEIQSTIDELGKLKDIVSFPDDEYSTPPLLPCFRGQDMFHEGDPICCLIEDNTGHHVWHETTVMKVDDNNVYPESRHTEESYRFYDPSTLTLDEYTWYRSQSSYRKFLIDRLYWRTFRQALLTFDSVDV